MRILFYSYAYPNTLQPRLGTFNRAMIAGLAAEHEIRVVSPVPFVDVWKARLRGNLPHGLNDSRFVSVPGVPAEYLTYYYTPRVLRTQYGRWMDWSVSRRLHQTIKSFQPDLVLSYWAHPDGEVAVRTAHRCGIPAVVMVGGSDVLLLGRSGKRQQKILDVMQNADAVVTVSDDIAKTLAADGVDSRKVRTVRRGVDRALFSPGDQQVARRGLGIPATMSILVSVGRLVPVKGHSHLLQACRLLATRGVPFRCYILGDGPLYGELQNQIKESGLSGQVELKGGQSQSQLAEWYRAATVTVLPSLSEGVPNVLMESIACGTPFVASDVGGIPEIADTRHDRLVPTASPVALADAIEWQIKFPQDKRTARSYEPLGLKVAAQKLAQVLDDVRSSPKTISASWQTFSPEAERNRRNASRNDTAWNMQNSLSTGSTSTTRSVLAAIPSASSSESGLQKSGHRIPVGALLSEELGRTGEEFVIPRR